MTPEERFFNLIYGIKNRKKKLGRKSWIDAFLRVNNRKTRHTRSDLIRAGYPMRQFVASGTYWSTIHETCRNVFIDGKGNKTYIWFGYDFFFLNETDAKKFDQIQLQFMSKGTNDKN